MVERSAKVGWIIRVVASEIGSFRVLWPLTVIDFGKSLTVIDFWLQSLISARLLALTRLLPVIIFESQVITLT